MFRRLLALFRASPPPSPADAGVAAVAAGPGARLRVIEVDDAEPVAGALFERTFRATIPRVPRHFVLLLEADGAAPVTLGYVHQTPFEGGVAHLSGGLIADAWQFRRLSGQAQAAIRERGGIAEWLMRDSIRLCQPCKAFYACIGDAKSRTVNERVGFRRAEGAHQYLFVNAMPGGAADELAALTLRVSQVGMF
ncbi:MAG: hypothetical protein QM750_23695 [Rubrivivax sp.]